MKTNISICISSLLIFIFFGIYVYAKGLPNAYRIPILLEGSLQNPAWSPDGNKILFTRFRDGYNKGPADLFIFDLKTHHLKLLVRDGSENVNLPGAVWNIYTKKIVFSSSREPHDEIYIIDENAHPGEEIKITDRVDSMAYEPSFSPNGEWIVFESHKLDVEEEGIIVKYKIDKTMPYILLTKEGQDCREPNWSPRGDFIVYQKFLNEKWDIWITDSNGENHKKLTKGPGDKTDASFSSNGDKIVYSSGGKELEFANLFIISISNGKSSRLTFDMKGYDGAPSWSPDGKRVVFESCQGDPENSPGTSIWIIKVPNN